MLAKWPHIKRIGSACAALLLIPAGASFGQQVVDSTFSAPVDKPALAETHPKVLIDEAHFNVHTAGGSYKPFADLIASDGCQVAPSAKKFSKESLQGCGVLVIANARGGAMRNDPNVDKPAFTDAECDAVRDWVGAGGALLFIADHWPIGSASERLARRFGVDMSKGRTMDPVNHDPSRPALSCLSFTRDNGLIGDHAITRGRNDSERIRRFTTFTGQSLKGPEGSVAFLKLANTAYDEVPPNGERVSAAGRAQGLALTYGKGRVVVLGEAACLTAQTAGGGRMAMGMNATPAGGNRMARGARRPVMRIGVRAADANSTPTGANAGAAGANGVLMGMNAPGLDNRQMALNIVRWLAGLLN